MSIIEIDGKTLEIDSGSMIIEAADAAGIYIPRFCYHKKLSIAANCRMCLVEIAGSRKPVPACATPIIDGMKVFTKSEETLRSQQAIMEFLLINHPLDCPVCDQGGECELQDLAIGFGNYGSEYQEIKRAVNDDDLGPLIATEMTRCIHCTRCVRFGEEIAGLRELGAISRGEKMQISTYVKHSLVSEISGNIIDLCPVGALTAKPSRFIARSWEITQYDGIAIHDCLGSNIHLHVLRNQLIRVVPKDNEQINETWLSDRDRFSYLGLMHKDRLKSPMIKKNGQWHEVDWSCALAFAAEGISQIIKNYGADQFAAFAAPSSTVEEFFLLQKLMRELGVNNLDHRLHQTDFRDQDCMPLMPINNINYAEIEQQDNLLILGCHLNREVPLAAVRVRKAYMRGANVLIINPIDYDYNISADLKLIISIQEIPIYLAKLLVAMLGKNHGIDLDLNVQRLLINVIPDSIMYAMAQRLKSQKSIIITGAVFENHPEAALLRSLLYLINHYCNIQIIHFTTGGNAAGGWCAGMVPHRKAGGEPVVKPGYNIQQSLDARLKGYLLLGVEPAYDFANPINARNSMLASEFIVLLSAYQQESMLDYANVILPIALYPETSGTYINLDNKWQTVTGVLQPYATSRPAWKIFRVLANLLKLHNFNYCSTTDVLNELKKIIKNAPLINYQPYYIESLPLLNIQQLTRIGEWPLYCCDAIVRHAQVLQQCAAADIAKIRINQKTAIKFNLSNIATVSQGEIEVMLPVQIDERLADDVVGIANAMPETKDLGHAFAEITIK